MPELAKSMENYVNKDVKEIRPSAIRDFDMQISSIPGLVKLTLGEPDFNVPEHVKQAAIRGIQANDSHYGPAAGKLELRKAVANYLKDTRNVDYNPEDEMLITNGGTEALTAITFSLLNPGDKVWVPTPVFSLYFPIITLTGAECIQVDTSADDFVLTPEKLQSELDQHGDVKMIILNYPCNPTGRAYPEDLLRKLGKILHDQNVLIVADEMYSELTYDQEHFSLATIYPEQTLLVSGLSKSHAMTGWRLGYIAGPSALISQIYKIHGFLVTCVNDIAQDAAIEALNNGRQDPDAFRAEYKKRRDYVVSRMEKMGFDIATPEGAFYVFAKIPAQFGNDDFNFALDLAKKAKVGVIPGSAFGAGGEGYIRISYAASDEKLAKAMDYIESYLDNLE
ncbi:aromatic-amino-acid transaminase [Limosilactobacillus coleohominis 101-4-CHN]|uniref:Aminotransferase n=1 Tax=Limosilactobacillus coleohominis 101-4-CHN TaxID=575594 RepID=C7XU17_9LACO|nr:aminotransferase class I/II-fold pyridoxal phosphate-dependent enzyme [Limosilactobacillus coleohominis]EEU30778.1 aromatic-amino-acid transaminase [Limosilactobacillus coleohominis 101-4-CHN]